MRGAKRETLVTGLRLGALSLKLTYDNTGLLPIAAEVGSPATNAYPVILGPLWFSTLHRKVLIQGSNWGALVSRGDGYTEAFVGNGLGTYAPAIDNADRLLSIGGGYRYLNASDSSEETYDVQGRLTDITWSRGDSVNLTYSTASTPTITAPSTGYLIQAQDNKGRNLGFQYNSAGRLTQITDTAGQAINLSYDIHDNLSSVTWEDGSTRTYLYENTRLPWALTGVNDERAVRYAIFGYDTAGRAISTEHAGGVNKYSASYTTPPIINVSETYDSSKQVVVRTHAWALPQGITVTTPLGSSASLGATTINGKTYMNSQSQPAGSGCSASTSAMTYDTNGNLTSADDFNAHRTCYANDLTRNLETTRVEGLPNTQACNSVTPPNAVLPAASRKTSTQWHPDWRLVTKVAEPGKITTSVYNGQPDPFSGTAIASCAPTTALLPDGKPIVVLCREVEQATTDADGHLGFSAAPQAGVPTREQKWTYNAFGQVLTHDGPRTDVTDTTTYVYYPDTAADHTRGDLQRTTNALGQVTNFTKYNKHGQVLQSTDPNGVATIHTYDLRQRLLSTSVVGQTTSYAYDPVGQLKKVTQPDASWIGYDYDAAHRLIAVSDNQGNRVDYTLDNAGNRIAENTKDPSGTLKRALSRSLDALGRVQQTTGRE